MFQALALTFGLIDAAITVCGDIPELLKIEVGGENPPRAESVILTKESGQVCEPIVIFQFCPPAPIC